MKNTVSILALAMLSLYVGFSFGERNNAKQKNDIVNCAYNKERIVETYNDWVNKALVQSDKRAEKYPVKVLDVQGIMEYNKIPEYMNLKMYEDFKNSKVCYATLLVNYTPNEEKENIEEIRVRYQKVATSPDEEGYYSENMLSAEYDVKDMKEQAVGFFKKYNKDKK